MHGELAAQPSYLVVVLLVHYASKNFGYDKIGPELEYIMGDFSP